MWAGISQPYKDAIRIYCVLKEHCFGTGDTYISVHRLNGRSRRYNGYTLSQYRPGEWCVLLHRRTLVLSLELNFLDK